MKGLVRILVALLLSSCGAAPVASEQPERSVQSDPHVRVDPRKVWINGRALEVGSAVLAEMADAVGSDPSARPPKTTYWEPLGLAAITDGDCLVSIHIEFEPWNIQFLNAANRMLKVEPYAGRFEVLGREVRRGDTLRTFMGQYKDQKVVVGITNAMYWIEMPDSPLRVYVHFDDRSRDPLITRVVIEEDPRVTACR